jgi:hypothetical protein
MVVYNAADSRYRSSGGKVIGTGTVDSQGRFEIPTESLPRGSIVDVIVTADGHTSVLVYGTYDETAERVDFDDFGSSGGDRRMPVGVQIPPFPFDGLLPD